MLTRAGSDAEHQTRERARAIAKAGGVEQALAKGLPRLAECTLSEAHIRRELWARIDRSR
jgi:hypothetical protein